ncbi:MAG: Fic family protein [Endomicrobia bacterium]|nr:Fic family protein [Bacillota bacterium]MCL1972212.1 Fic family protein [Endomicrobiia bacterium]
MFKPKYSLAPKLLENISSVERLYGQIEQLRLPKSLWLNLERNNLVQSTYVSNSIEGNSLSLPEVTNLLLGGRVPATRDEKEVANYFSVLKKLSSLKELNLKNLLSIHKELLTGVNDKIAGKIRNNVVVVGNRIKTPKGVEVIVKHNPPYHKKEQIEKHLKELFDWSENYGQTLPIIKAGIFHHQYVHIHPFADGNGRTCRLLTALFLIKNGYQINKYFVLDDFYDTDRKLYSDKLSTADKGDLTQWLEYFTDGLKYSLQSAIDRAENSLSEVSVSMRLTPRESQVLEKFSNIGEFTSGDVIKFLNVSRQQVNVIVKGLIEKGRIAKQGGNTKGVFYKIL